MTPIMQHPKGTLCLTIVETANTLVYFGLMVSLVLFITESIQLSTHQALVVYGIYLTLLYSLPLLGGFVADKWLGAHRAIAYGLTLIILGCLILAFHSHTDYLLGIATCVCGIGLVKPSTPGLLGRFYADSSQNLRKEHGFTVFYAGMNIGAVIGPIMFGIISGLYGWPPGFIICAVATLAVLLFYLTRYSYFGKFDRHSYFSKTAISHFITHGITLAGLAGCVWVLNQLMHHLLLYKILTGAILLCATTGILTLAIQQKALSRNRLFVLLAMNIITMCFFIAELQMGGSLTLFIKESVNRNVFGWMIPTEALTALLPIFVVLGVWTLRPIYKLFSNMESIDRLLLRIILGLCFACLSFVIFYAVSAHIWTHPHLDLVGIVLGYFLLGTGEISTGPMMNVATTHLAPGKLQSSFMGVYYLFTAGAGYLASVLSDITLIDNKHYDFNHTFLLTIGFTLSIIIIATLVFKPLVRMCHK